MYLQKLELQNFKCFEEIELDFCPGLTVIVGANGAGKTSILEGAAIALSTMFVKMDGLTARGIDKSQAHLKAYSVGSTRDIQPQYPVTVRATAKTKNEMITWSRSLNKAGGNTTQIDAKQMVELGIAFQKDLRRGDTTLILPVLAYYGTGRLWDYHREKQSDIFETNNRMNGYIDCVDGTANLKLMMNWFSKMTIQKYQDKELGFGDIPELEAVYSAMETCYKRITGYDNVKIQYNVGTKDLEIAYCEPSGEWMRMSINQLSDGYKSTISLVADIAYRMAVLNPQLLGNAIRETDGIVLIDEVDLHLHPVWQERILDDLTQIFPKVQFIVTTHAPAVINTAKSDSIVILENLTARSPEGEVYGKNVGSVVNGIMKATDRPRRIKEQFDLFYRNLEEKKLVEAEAVLNELEKQLQDDIELAGCKVKLALKKRMG